MKKELTLNSEIKNGIIPTVVSDSTEVVGQIYNRKNFLSALLGAGVGAVTGAPTALAIVVTVYDGDVVDDEDTPTSITDEAATSYVLTLADVEAGSAEAFINLDLTGLKPWIRIGAVATFTAGTTPTANITSTFVFGDPRYSEQVTDAQNIATWLD